MHKQWMVVLLVGLSLSLTCPAQGDVILNGAGATFPHPLYKRWIEVYSQQSGIRISYEAVGSGAGIKKLLDRSVDFGATDAFLSDEELQKEPSTILHVPTCLGAVSIIYNLPGIDGLRLSPDLLVDILLGKRTKWSDKRIAEHNKSVALPDEEITVVHRSDRSGTSFVLTDFLTKVSEEWRERIGRGQAVRWPAGVGVEGNPGVAETVKRIRGSIGYVELTYAKEHRLPVALVKNRAGVFLSPTLESVASAARISLPSDTRVLITDTTAPDGYPISAFTWLIFYQEQSYKERTTQRAEALARFLMWSIHEGQRFNAPLDYAPLPKEAVTKAERIIRSMTYQGDPVTHD